MRFKYRNVKTGAEFESNCEISAPTLVRVEAEAPAPIIEPEPQITDTNVVLEGDADKLFRAVQTKAKTKTKAQTTKTKKGAKK